MHPISGQLHLECWTASPTVHGSQTGWVIIHSSLKPSGIITCTGALGGLHLLLPALHSGCDGEGELDPHGAELEPQGAELLGAGTGGAQRSMWQFLHWPAVVLYLLPLSLKGYWAKHSGQARVLPKSPK